MILCPSQPVKTLINISSSLWEFYILKQISVSFWSSILSSAPFKYSIYLVFLWINSHVMAVKENPGRLHFLILQTFSHPCSQLAFSLKPLFCWLNKFMASASKVVAESMLMLKELVRFWSTKKYFFYLEVLKTCPNSTRASFIRLTCCKFGGFFFSSHPDFNSLLCNFQLFSQ